MANYERTGRREAEKSGCVGRPNVASHPGLATRELSSSLRPRITSRGPAAPHTLPAVSGRERHVRDSPVVLGCARTLAAARHLQAWHLACSASGDLPQPGPLPRLGAQYLSHIHLPSCGALIFIPSGLRPWARSWFSTCSKRPDWPQLGKRLVDAQKCCFCTVMAGCQRAAGQQPSPACSSI